MSTFSVGRTFSRRATLAGLCLVVLVAGLLPRLGHVLAQIPEPIVNVHMPRTVLGLEDEGIIVFSAINLIGSEQMQVQLVLEVPSGWSVSSAEATVSGGGGLWNGVFHVDPGQQRLVEVRVKANELGEFDIRGKAIWVAGTFQSSHQMSKRVVVIGARTTSDDTATSGPIRNASSLPHLLWRGIHGWVGLGFALILVALAVLGVAHIGFLFAGFFVAWIGGLVAGFFLPDTLVLWQMPLGLQFVFAGFGALLCFAIAAGILEGGTKFNRLAVATLVVAPAALAVAFLIPGALTILQLASESQYTQRLEVQLDQPQVLAGEWIRLEGELTTSKYVSYGGLFKTEHVLWRSDHGRKGLYLEDRQGRQYIIRDAGGIFGQTFKLERGVSYKGWWAFGPIRNPSEKVFTLYHPRFAPREVRVPP